MTRADQEAFLRYVARSSPQVAAQMRRTRGIISGMYFLAGAAMVVVGATVAGRPWVWYSLAAVWLVLAGWSWWRMRPEMLQERTLAMVRKAKTELGYTGPVALTLADDGLHEEGSATTAHIGWGAMQCVEDVMEHVLVKLKGGNVMVIPKRAFASGSEQDLFRATIESHLTPPTAPRPG